MVGDQDPNAPVPQVIDDGLDIADRDGVHPGKGFVQQDEFRLRGQGAGYLHPAALAAGQGLSLAVAQVLDVEFGQQFVPSLQPLLLVQVRAGLEDGHEVLADSQFPEDRGLLGEVAYPAAGPLVHGQGGYILVVDGYRAAIGTDDADDHIETGGLAGPVGAQQSDHLAALDFQ